MGIQSAYDVGRDEFAVTGFQSYFRKFVINYDDFASGLYKIPVEAGRIVLGVIAIVSGVFDGTPSLDVGTGADDDAFVDSTDSDIDLTSAGAFYNREGGANAAPRGVNYAAAGLVSVKLTATNPSKGKLTVLVHELDITDSWRAAGLGV